MSLPINTNNVIYLLVSGDLDSMSLPINNNNVIYLLVSGDLRLHEPALLPRLHPCHSGQPRHALQNHPGPVNHPRQQ